MTWPLRTLGRQVPLARRMLFADRRHGALTVAGVAAALLLVLILDAVFTGAVRGVTYYLRTSPADVFISQAGVRTMHMSSSTLQPGTALRAATVPGAAWAAPIGFVSGAMLASRQGRQLAYVVGYDPSTGRGGPRRLLAGRPPGAGEAVVDRLAADQLGLHLGDTSSVLGVPLRVVGLTTGYTSITNTTVFVSLAQFGTLRGPTISYVLVHSAPGTSPVLLAERLTRALPGLSVQTREQFTASEARIVTDMSADLMRLMAFVGMLIALAVIALGLLTTTLARLDEYAVLKAIGAPTSRLALTVAAQVAWVVALALATATGTALLIAAIMASVAPTIPMAITATSIARLGTTALLAGVAAALVPLRRLSTIDAATAFGEAR